MGKQLVARERELAELVTAVTDGHGAVLSGPAGVGKTALAAAVAEHVEAFRRPGRAAGRHGRQPLDPVRGAGAAAARRHHPAAPGARAGRDPPAPSELGGSAPALLVVDDAHLLDDHSAATLLGLVTHAAPCGSWPRCARASPRPTPCTRCGRTASSPATRSPRSIAWRPSSSSRAILGGEVGRRHGQPAVAAHPGQRALSERARPRRPVAHRRLVDEHGVWIWRGGLTVPPRLGDLLDRRFDGLSPAGLDALGALVLGEPLPLAALEDDRDDGRHRRAGGPPGRRGQRARRRSCGTASPIRCWAPPRRTS